MKKLVNMIASNTKAEIMMLLHSMSQFNDITPTIKSFFVKRLTLLKYKASEVVLKQGEPVNKIFFVKRGSFKYSHFRKKEEQVDFNLDYFIKYQEMSGERFSNNRKYEIQGSYSYIEDNRYLIASRGEMICDIEWLLSKKTSMFNITALEPNSELLSTSFEDFEKFIVKIKSKITKLITTKIRVLNDRANDIHASKKHLTITRKKRYQADIIKQFNVAKEYNEKKRNCKSSEPKKRKVTSKDALFYFSDEEERNKNFKKVNLKETKTGLNRVQKSNLLYKAIINSKKSKIISDETIQKLLVSVGNSRNLTKSFLTSDVKPSKMKFTSSLKKRCSSSAFTSVRDKDRKTLTVKRNYDDAVPLFRTTNLGLTLNFSSPLIRESGGRGDTKKKTVMVPMNKKIFLDKKKIDQLIDQKYTLLRSFSNDTLFIQKKQKK